MKRPKRRVSYAVVAVVALGLVQILAILAYRAVEDGRGPPVLWLRACPGRRAHRKPSLRLETFPRFADVARLEALSLAFVPARHAFDDGVDVPGP